MLVPEGRPCPTVAATAAATRVVSSAFSLPPHVRACDPGPALRPIPRPGRQPVRPRGLRAHLLVLLAGAAVSLPAQQLAEGYGGQVLALPAAAGNVLTMPGEEVVWFDGSDLWLRAAGQPPRSLRHFAPPVFGSFTLALDGNHVLFGESSTHGLWVVPLHSVPSHAPLATVPFNYDGVLLAPGKVLVSAKTNGFGSPDNEVLVVDVATGGVQLLAQLPGASGPVALAPNGDLYYATGSLLFPTPPGTCTILRFRRPVVDQALTANQVLGPAHAEVVFAGLDAAADLAFDDDGDLLFTDWWTNTLGQLREATGPAPARTNLLDYTSAAVGASGVQFVRGAGAAVFEPFQPTAGTLLVHETSWGTTSQLRSLRAQRAVASPSAGNPIPAGPFVVQVSQGPRQGFGLVAIGLSPGLGESPLAIAGFGQPLFWDAALGGALATWFTGFDATGRTAVAFQNPGLVPAQSFVLQAAFVDAGNGAIGTTAPIVVRLGP